MKTGRGAGGGEWVFLEVNDGSCFNSMQVQNPILSTRLLVPLTLYIASNVSIYLHCCQFLHVHMLVASELHHMSKGTKLRYQHQHAWLALVYTSKGHIPFCRR